MGGHSLFGACAFNTRMRMKILWTFTFLATISSNFAHYIHYHENPQDNAILIQEAGIREPNPIIWPRFARSDEVLSKDDFYLRSGRSVDYGKLHKMDLMLRIKKLIKMLTSQIREEDVPIMPVKREKEKAEEEPSYVNYFKLRT